MEDESLAADPDRVAGVVTALIASDDIEAIGKDVDDLALAFVAPLRTDNRKILVIRHDQIKPGSAGRFLLCLEIVAAILVDFSQVLGDQGKNPALRKVFSVDLTIELTVDFLEERALQQDLAAGTATGAFSTASGEELIVVACVDV